MELVHAALGMLHERRVSNYTDWRNICYSLHAAAHYTPEHEANEDAYLDGR